MSSREMLFQREQFTNSQIPISDLDLITQQHESKLRNHKYSEKSKAPLKDFRPEANVDVGDLVYLYTDKDKTKSRDRYIIVSSDNDWIFVRKFTGKQLRNASYKIKKSECYKVPSSMQPPTVPVSSNIYKHDTTPNHSDAIVNDPVSTMSEQSVSTNHQQATATIADPMPKIPKEIIPHNSQTISNSQIESHLNHSSTDEFDDFSQ